MTWPFEETGFRNEGIRLHAIAAGPANGALVILLHGFPEFWFAWRRQIAALAAAGFRVIAPDQRGYNTSDKPAGVQAYAIPHLVSDVIAIADYLGHDKFFLAGHDWGGAVAWMLAASNPRRVSRIAILNVPHPATMLRFLRRNPRQMLRSWYILYFQIPRLPEAAFAARNFRAGTSALERTSLPGTFSAADLDQYREAWSRPGALTGMINWYRAFFRDSLRNSLGPLHIEVPALILWGDRDVFLLPAQADDSLRHCARGEVVHFPGCTHWLHHEEPARVNRQLIEFFRR